MDSIELNVGGASASIVAMESHLMLNPLLI